MDIIEKRLLWINPIKGNIWREFTNFSLHCVVMVLANFPFDPKDYIRDYQLFLREVRNDSSLV